MTPRELWERYKALLFDDPALGVRLDLSRMGLDDRALADREPSLQGALAAMEALEQGAIANPDEKRLQPPLPAERFVRARSPVSHSSAPPRGRSGWGTRGSSPPPRRSA
jgi:hypothetical protein